MNHNMPDLPNDPREAAAYWFARVHSGSFTPDEAQRFNDWRQADSRHQQEYLALDEIWQASSLIPEDELRALLQTSQSSSGARRGPTRRQWMAAGAAACAAAIAAGIGLAQILTQVPSFQVRYATAAGEQRTETLPDGSVLDLNTRSRIVVRYFKDQRKIELQEGEVMFSVAHNTQRPFYVEAGDVSVRVTGTQFNIRRDAAQVSVAVQSGSVQVSSGRWWHRRMATLTANQRTRAQPDKALDVETADIAVLTAWREGKVVFKEQPLERVIQEMNRYLMHPVRLTDSRLKHLNMTGVFNVKDADAFLHALRSTLPVSVRMRADGGADIALVH